MPQKALNEMRFDESGKRFACPKCQEWVAPADIEVIQMCPYCNCPLEMTPELEDFIIEPLVNHWLKKCASQPFSGGRS